MWFGPDFRQVLAPTHLSSPASRQQAAAEAAGVGPNPAGPKSEHFGPSSASHSLVVFFFGTF